MKRIYGPWRVPAVHGNVNCREVWRQENGRWIREAFESQIRGKWVST